MACGLRGDHLPPARLPGVRRRRAGAEAILAAAKAMALTAADVLGDPALREAAAGVRGARRWLTRSGHAPALADPVETRLSCGAGGT
jgi:hypothetical protein